MTQVFPDAQLVMTHRDPADVVGSACSLIKAVRQLTSEKVDLLGIGRTMVETFEIMIARTNAFKAKHGPDAIFDIQYADMVRDPIATVATIYKRFDTPLTQAATSAMTSYLANNPQGKHGKHSYTLEEYGLTREAVHARFADYIRDYNIPVISR